MKKGIICYQAERESEHDIEYSLRELTELAGNVDIEITETIVQHRDPNPAFLMGMGKLEEIRARAEREEVEVLVFGQELSPRQVKNLEDFFPGQEIWDRTQVILEIFRRRAHSREGKIQVELATLTYLYPRMLGMGKMLSRLGGGIGTRGPGETRLEVMRRTVRKEISKRRQELADIRRNREVLRKKRERSGVGVVSLVGYTNAGKSTLLNALMASEKEVLAKGELFATLDPVWRRAKLPSGRTFLLTDTVGFIKDLPHRVEEAFMATLEELAQADLLIHVIDLTSPYMDEQIEAVEVMLNKMHITDTPVIKAYNKVDVFDGEPPRDGIVISAATGENLSALLELVESILYPEREVSLTIPFEKIAVLGGMRGCFRILREDYTDQGLEVSLVGASEAVDQLVKRLTTWDGDNPS